MHLIHDYQELFTRFVESNPIKIKIKKKKNRTYYILATYDIGLIWGLYLDAIIQILSSTKSQMPNGRR